MTCAKSAPIGYFLFNPNFGIIPGNDGEFAETAAICSHSSPVATVTGTKALLRDISFKTSEILIFESGINSARRFNTASGSVACSRIISIV